MNRKPLVNPICLRRHSSRSIAALAAAAQVALASAASAIVIRDDVPAGQYTGLALQPQYAPVGALSSADGFLSGTVISPKWVLTAGHGVDTSAISTFTIGGGSTSDPGAVVYLEAQHFAHPSHVQGQSDLNDVGLIRFSSAIAGITPATRLFGSEFNQLGTMVGYGLSGNGVTGKIEGTNGTKRAGQNMLDGTFSNFIESDFDRPAPGSGSLNTYGGAVAGSLEGCLASGDSGGGTFVDMPRTYLAAVHSGASPAGGYDSLMASVRVSQFNVWIDDNIDHLWGSASSGTFSLAGNWNLGPGSIHQIPGSGDIVGFKTAGTYTVSFAGNAITHQLLSRGGNVTLNLNGFTLSQISTMLEGSVVVGRYGGNSASVMFMNGTVNSAGDAILAQRSGSSGTVTVGGGATWNVAGSLHVGGAADIGLTSTADGAGGSGVLNVNTATSTLNVTGTLKVHPTGTVNYSAGSLSVGPLSIGDGGRVNLTAGGNKVLRSTGLTISPDGGGGGGRLDLSDNDMIVNYSGGSPLAGIRTFIRNGYNNGSWTGVGGIRSSRAATSPNAGEIGKTALGYGEASALGRSTFDGFSIDTTAILIKYTYVGDSDLDGDADGVDIGNWATNFTGELSGAGSMFWTQGDWDYDGDVDGVDAGKWASSFTGELSGGGLSVYVESALSREAAHILHGMGITVVPEPVTSFGLICLGAAWSLQRPRQRHGARTLTSIRRR